MKERERKKEAKKEREKIKEERLNSIPGKTGICGMYYKKHIVFTNCKFVIVFSWFWFVFQQKSALGLCLIQLYLADLETVSTTIRINHYVPVLSVK